MTFTENDKLKVLAIIHIFETSRPFGDYAACVVLNDGAGVSYGTSQFTHRSGSLADVVQAYLDNGGTVGRLCLENTLPTLRLNTVYAIRKLSVDDTFKKALKAAAVTREMEDAQNTVAFDRYLKPALRICEAKGFTEPLSLAVVFDSLTHGSWEWISRNVSIPANAERERMWITDYVRKRHLWLTNIARLRSTNCRTKFFLGQIAIGNWELKLPVIVHGLRLTESMLRQASREAKPTAGESTSDKPAAEPDKSLLETAGEKVAAASQKFDRVDGIVTSVTTRRDAAKSMWTTIVGTLGQAVWAVTGFLIGLPKSVWIVVAVIAAIFLLAYLYRQIALGKIREANKV